MNENLDDKTMQDYAAGALSGDALRSFEHRLQHEPDLQAELDLYLALKASDNLRLKKHLLGAAQADNLAPAKPPAGITRQISVWLAAAASVALLITAVWWWQQSAKPDAAQLAQSYLDTPYPSPIATMGAGDTLEPALRSAFLAYRDGDYATAANQLTVLASAPDASDEALFYTGEALLQSGNANAAIAYFDRVRPGYWRESADWRSALALIKSGQPERAKPFLENLRFSARKARVEALLKALK